MTPCTCVSSASASKQAHKESTQAQTHAQARGKAFRQSMAVLKSPKNEILILCCAYTRAYAEFKKLTTNFLDIDQKK